MWRGRRVWCNDAGEDVDDNDVSAKYVDEHTVWLYTYTRFYDDNKKYSNLPGHLLFYPHYTSANYILILLLFSN